MRVYIKNKYGACFYCSLPFKEVQRVMTKKGRTYIYQIKIAYETTTQYIIFIKIRAEVIKNYSFTY